MPPNTPARRPGCIHFNGNATDACPNLPATLFQKNKWVRTRPERDDGLCPICAAYGFWSKQPSFKGEAVRSDAREEHSFEQGKKLQTKSVTLHDWHKEHLKENHKWPSKINMPVRARMNGEAYHALVCALLWPTGSKVLYDDETTGMNPAPSVQEIAIRKAKSHQQLLFLSFYNIKKVEKIPADQRAAMHEATEAISAVFRLPTKDDLRTSKKNVDHQAKIFDFINKTLNGPLPQTKSADILKYTSAIWIAKFWLDRFLKLTKQLPNPAAAPNLHESQAYLGLPKSKPGTKVAMIFVRFAPATPVGKIMDLANLERCVRCVVAANRLARLASPPESVFTHILFFGDIDYRRGRGLSELVRDIENPILENDGGSALVTLYITSPWDLNPVNMTGLNDEEQRVAQAVSQYWQCFRAEPNSIFGAQGTVTENVPLQTKIYAMFAALRQRYGDNICAIGFRSGFIEGASFLGIPVFYLNDVTMKKLLQKSRTNEIDVINTGRALWDGDWVTRELAAPDDRLLEAGLAMSTLICIDFQAPTGDQNITFPITPQGRRLLTAALLVFMLVRKPDAQPLWKERVWLIHEMLMKKHVAGTKTILQIHFESCLALIQGTQGLRDLLGH
ncbi:hypothetical protein K431DRAFT_298182 [Polychaeton citri CBS 116435]|uniref:Uncharacterized protein n=1 Tax=Polychaeton citri CBS 116435 TaxID=1314669 RepID=A0A9P4Q016_9PEZI|nr:hypothetical protein K431DRAFT_298182 [Polychaeton citri CBS 116435]